MQNTKIIQFLKTLSKSEIRDFGKFVRSPYHNNRKDVIKFFDILKKYYPEFNVNGEVIYKKLYPDKTYDSNSIILFNSYLYNLGKEYFAISDFKENNLFYKYHMLNSFDKHRADNLFEKEINNAEDYLNKEKINTDFFLHKSLLEKLKNEFSLSRNRQDTTCQNTINYGDYSVYSFIIKLAFIYHDTLANKISYNFEFSDSTLSHFLNNFNFEEFINTLEDKNIKNKDYILYYCYFFICYYHPENIHYYAKLKEYSFKDFESLDSSEKSSRFNCLIDYCIFQLESGKLEFLNESFNLYLSALDKKIFQADPNDKDIGLMYFRNFVTIGLAAKQCDHVERFISVYGKEIKGEFKNDLLELSYAMLYYEKKDYDKSLECISRVSSAISLFKLPTKYILIKIYYDTNQFDSLFSLIDTYKHYLKNDKIIPDRTRNLHTMLLNYITKLAKIKSSGRNDDLFNLKKEINNNSNMDFRHKLWLIEKADEIENID